MSFAKRPEVAPIHELQVMLRKIDPSHGLNVDGIFGKETESAVRSFQRENGLQDTGKADLETWEAIRKAYQLAKVLRDQAEPLLLTLQPNQTLEKGSNNLHMYLVQAMLLALSRLLSGAPGVRVNGRLDQDTEKAIKWLQKRWELEETGALDRNTWRHLNQQYRTTVGDGTGTFPYYQTQRKIELPKQTEL